MPRRLRAAIAAPLATAALLADCAPAFDYSATAQAPAAEDYPETSDSGPEQAGGVVRLELDSGATVAIWIDPDDITQVHQQHSDPDDPAAWTEPTVLFEAGDGCLGVAADTDGETVAATLECYADDAWSSQAPDQGQAVVTTDLEEWLVEDMGEFYADPVVTGGDVEWRDTPGDDVVATYDGGAIARTD